MEEHGGEVRSALDLSYADSEPRAGLEDEIVGALRADGLLGSTPRWRSFGLQAAAAVVLFVAGWGAGRAGGEAGPVGPAPLGPQAMLLLWEGPDFVADQSLSVEYAQWGANVAGSGVAVSGDELAPAGELFGPTLEELLFEGEAAGVAPPGGAYRLGGYFLLGTTPDDAARLAETHPHRRAGGWVEVVPVITR